MAPKGAEANSQGIPWRPLLPSSSRHSHLRPRVSLEISPSKMVAPWPTGSKRLPWKKSAMTMVSLGNARLTQCLSSGSHISQGTCPGYKDQLLICIYLHSKTQWVFTHSQRPHATTIKLENVATLPADPGSSLQPSYLQWQNNVAQVSKQPSTMLPSLWFLYMLHFRQGHHPIFLANLMPHENVTHSNHRQPDTKATF